MKINILEVYDLLDTAGPMALDKFNKFINDGFGNAVNCGPYTDYL